MSDLDEWEREYDAWEATRDRIRDEFIAEARARFGRDRIVSVESYGDEVRFTSSLTKSARPGAAYQVTDFEGDEPIGHREYDDLDEALVGLWDVASPRTKAVPPMPNPAPVDPDIVGALVSGEYHGTPFEGRVHSLDAYGHAEVDVPVGWTHRGRDYSEGIVTDVERLKIMQPRAHGKVTYANETWTWTRVGGKPWPRNRRNPERSAFRYRYLGTDDEESVCACCGRQNLKRVAWLVELDDDGNELGEPRPYGTTCAGMLLRGAHVKEKKPTKAVAEKLLEEDRKASLREAWALALEQPLPQIPPARIGPNAYGIDMVFIGDEPIHAPEFRWDESPGQYKRSVEHAQGLWREKHRLAVALQIAKDMGLRDVSIYEIAKISHGATRNPSREHRLRSRITRA